MKQHRNIRGFIKKHSRKIGISYLVIVEATLFFGFILATVVTYQGVMQSISKPEVLSNLRSRFDRNYNYTDLYYWERNNLNWTDGPIPEEWNRNDPIEILDHAKGKCGEFANVYVALCLAHGYQARLVVNVFGDHEWVEVKNGGKGVHVDPSLIPSDTRVFNHPFMYESWKNTPFLLIAIDGSTVEDVTANYRSGFWINILSWQMVILFSTVMVVFALILKNTKPSVVKSCQ